MSPLDDKWVESELRLLPDGRLMIHNLTPALARLLHEFAPGDAAMRSRAEFSRNTFTAGHSDDNATHVEQARNPKRR